MRRLVIATMVVALSASPGATFAAEEEALVAATGGPASIEPNETSAADAEQPRTFTLEPTDGRSFEGWTEVARASAEGGLRWLGVVGDRLVAIGNFSGPEEESDHGDSAWYSDDGSTWTATPFPGQTPQVTDLAVRPDGSMAVVVGYTLPDWSEHGTEGAVWVTTDGLEWVKSAPPPVDEVDFVAAWNDAVVAAGDGHTWVTTDLETWKRVRGPSEAPIEYGLGGFLVSEGGGQDLLTRTALWHSADGLKWTKVKLPTVLRKGKNAFTGISVFALDDGWVLVPETSKRQGLMYVSPDGKRWRKGSRPPGMADGYVWWMADVGDKVQAVGWLPDRRKQPDGIWTFVPGKPVAKPKSVPEGFAGEPVEWNGELIAYGWMDGEGDTTILTMWRHQ